MAVNAQADPPIRRRRGCLALAVLVIIAAVLLPCGVVGVVLVAASPPGGFHIGEDALSFAADLQPLQFEMQLRYRAPGQESGDTLCYHEQNLVIIFDPLEVRRVPGCQCVTGGADNRYTVIECGEE